MIFSIGLFGAAGQKLTRRIRKDCRGHNKFQSKSIIGITQKPGTRPGFRSCICEQSERPPARQVLLGGHFFGFAFLAHHFEFAFLRFELGSHFLLDPLCRLFQLR
jgi:hypothetical protein